MTTGIGAVRPLFPVRDLSPIPGFVRVQRTEKFVQAFWRLYNSQTECLYNHSPIFPFAYLNKGRMKLYLNSDWESTGFILPLVQKNDLTPTFTLHTPLGPPERIQAVIEAADKISVHPVEITDCTKSYAERFLRLVPGWEARKTSDDVIQRGQAIAQLTGRHYSSLRNTLKHVRQDLHPDDCPLSAETKADALQVFNEWKETQGKKYFRVTIGRDLRLIEEYHNAVDMKDYFGFVYYVDGKPSAANFGCRSWHRSNWGIDVTCKANIHCKGLGDYAFWHLVREMNAVGIEYVNDSGAASKNVKINKIKWQPEGSIPMFDLRRTEKK